MTDPRALRRLHQELRAVVRELTQPIERTIIRDDHTSEKVVVPSLLDQLRDEKQPDTGAGRGRGAGSPAPLSVEATDMLAQIEADAIYLHTEAVRTEHTVESRIQAIAAIAGRWADAHQVGAAVGYLRAWAGEIRGFLDPPQRLHINAPCPACGVKMVPHWDGPSRETVLVPALSYDPDRGAVCLNPQCRHVWPHSNLEHLAQVLDEEEAKRTGRKDDQHG